ncbi:FolC bifunctional protein [Testicularia cyperi]|uniref:tetrahydrofolate synthase n=1 Tax=Testicularia cyperi TaxID=1882483 RepID=A0A317Y0V1_9BASI|nr:FolC bifunctional protein [Testicularia cyperi]
MRISRPHLFRPIFSPSGGPSRVRSALCNFITPLSANPTNAQRIRASCLPLDHTAFLSPLTVRKLKTMAAITSDSGSMFTPANATRSYDDAIEALNSLQSNAATIEAIRKSGGRMNDFAIPEMLEYLARIGYQPSDLNRLNVVHITGTKGKGSTSAFVDSLFRQLSQSSPSPVKIGLYTSPHMTSVRERIRINSLPISNELFTQYFWDVWDRLAANPERKLELTPLRPVYFRFLTLLAFHIFLSEGVDTVILEVGIGGKYDSTNIVPSPTVAGITQLGLDHTALLGNTVEEIAVQKAGIFKPDAPAVCWLNQPGDAITHVKQVAQQTGVSKLTLVDLHPALQSAATATALPPSLALPSSSDPAASDDSTPVRLGLPGLHQRTNASLALELVNVFLESEAGQALFAASPFRPDSGDKAHPLLAPWQRKGLELARWPGRCQTVPSSTHKDLTWFLDGAHTTDSLGVCLDWFVTQTEVETESMGNQSHRVLVFNCTNGRSAEELLTSVLGTVECRLRDVSTQSTPSSDETAGKFPLASQFFDLVIFTTNITFEGGGWSSELTSKALDDSDLVNLTIQNELARTWASLAPASTSQVVVSPSIQATHDRIREFAAAANKTDSLVTGSLHLVGGLMAHLQNSSCLDQALISTVRP